jgi:hypothetical protein
MFRRLQQITNRQVLWILLAVALGASLISMVIAMITGAAGAADWWIGWFQNFSTEIFGAFMTFILLEVLVHRREEKERLIRQMRSRNNAMALQAVAELGAHGWLGDGSLEEASLWNANLTGVNMWDVNLRGGDLHGASLQGAKLERANLTRANLWNANLENCLLSDVTLEGADLFHAKLNGARLRHTEFDGKTRLPDGSYWTPESDLAQFGVSIEE